MKNNEEQISTDLDQAEEILFEALELESENERNAFVEKKCAGDNALLQEVDLLLESAASADKFFAFDTPIEVPAQEFIDIISDHLKDFPGTTPDLSEGGAQR